MIKEDLKILFRVGRIRRRSVRMFANLITFGGYRKFNNHRSLSVCPSQILFGLRLKFVSKSLLCSSFVHVTQNTWVLFDRNTSMFSLTFDQISHFSQQSLVSISREIKTKIESIQRTIFWAFTYFNCLLDLLLGY